MSTNKPMTQEQLDAIRERLDVRTSGPWRAIICESEDHPPHGNGVIASGSCWPVVDDETMRVEDADLIAHAPEDLADLLAEVERLQQFESIVSWQWGDTTDGRTREDMVERALRQSYGPKAWQEMCESEDDLDIALVATSRDDMRDTLNAALNPGDRS